MLMWLTMLCWCDVVSLIFGLYKIRAHSKYGKNIREYWKKLAVCCQLSSNKIAADAESAISVKDEAI